MSDSDFLPNGVNMLTPYIAVSDVQASFEFYEKAFGFERGLTLKGKDGEIAHAEMQHCGKLLMMMSAIFSEERPMRPPVKSGEPVAVNFYVHCPDVDMLINQARLAGATILDEPADQFWGERTGSVKDPDGYVWTFATRKGDFNPEDVPSGFSLG